MDPAQALAELTKVSAHIEAAVIYEEDGPVVASTLDGERASRIAKAAAQLVAEAPEGVVQLEAAFKDGSVFVVREGRHAVAATTGSEPPIGLVIYDLRACLRGLDGETQGRAKAGSEASGAS